MRLPKPRKHKGWKSLAITSDERKELEKQGWNDVQRLQAIDDDLCVLRAWTWRDADGRLHMRLSCWYHDQQLIPTREHVEKAKDVFGDTAVECENVNGTLVEIREAGN